MWPFKAIKVSETPEPEKEDKMDKALDDIHKMVDKLKVQDTYGVTRDNRDDAYLKAIIAMHPEVETHPEVLAFKERCLKYKREVKDEKMS